MRSASGRRSSAATIPESRFNPTAEKGIAELLKDCANAVSVAIGGKVNAA
jgi:hypothetical protein